MWKNSPIKGVEIKKQEWDELQDWMAGSEEGDFRFIIKHHTQHYLQQEQIENIFAEDREQNSIYSTVTEILTNPYILCESYVGNNLDDKITFSKIDHGIMPSP